MDHLFGTLLELPDVHCTPAVRQRLHVGCGLPTKQIRNQTGVAVMCDFVVLLFA